MQEDPSVDEGAPDATPGGHVPDWPSLQVLLDGELLGSQRRELVVHLGGCNPCLQLADLEVAVRQLVARACCAKAPAQLRVRVLMIHDDDA